MEGALVASEMKTWTTQYKPIFCQQLTPLAWLIHALQDDKSRVINKCYVSGVLQMGCS